MNKVLSLAAVQLTFVVAAGSVAFAIPTDDWAKDTRNRTGVSEWYSPMAGIAQGVGRKDSMDNRWGFRTADPSLRCTTGECPQISTTYRNMPGTLKRGIMLPAPINGQTDTQNSAALASLESQSLNYINSSLKIMYEYLDSGVAGGLFKANMQAAEGLTHRYLAVNTVINQAELMPEIKSVIGSGFLGCMNKVQGAGGAAGAQNPWVVATDVCLNELGRPSAANFSQSGATAMPNWMTSHPDAPTTATAGDTAVFLSDLLVEPIRRQLGTFVGPPDPNHPLPDPDALKANFRRYFGDKSYAIPIAARGMGLAPTEETWAPDLSPELLQKQFFDDTWIKLHELMRGYCEFQRAAVTHEANGHQPFPYTFTGFVPYFPFVSFGPSQRDFWRNINQTYGGGATGPTPARMIGLKTSTFSMNDVVGDALFTLFVKTQDISAPTGGGAAPHPLDYGCDQLKATNPGEGSYYDDLAKNPQKNALPWREMFTRLTRIIASGRRLDLYTVALQKVNEWTASSSDASLLRDETRSLTDRVTEGGLEAMRASLSEDVNSFVSDLQARKQMETGALGSQIPAGVAGRGGSDRSPGSITGT